MLFFGGGLGLIAIALWIFCVIDTITTPDNQVRNLPKLAWVFIVLLFLDIGAIAWLLAGRPWNKVPANRTVGRGAAGVPRADGRAPVARRVASNPDDDEEFLASLRKRADEQRRRAGDDKNTGRNDIDPS
jgi:Phospholipase_D-nuclease N-terminal